MSFANILITGANRGIGLEFVRQYAPLEEVKRIFATCREESPIGELKKLSTSYPKVKVMTLDVKHYDKYEQFFEDLSKELDGEGLNLLVNNAGIHIRVDLPNAGRENMLEVYEVNVVAPLLFTRALVPLLKRSAESGHKTLVANISSKVGSIADNRIGQLYAYRTSKTALNQVSKNLAIDLQPSSIIVTAIHPGWVKTDMGGPNALIEPKESIEHMINTFKTITLKETGSFLNYDGTVIPY